jgi:mono/diheme cytochrome c family protein/thiol-disulfide isomerase/thioredoxin
MVSVGWTKGVWALAAGGFGLTAMVASLAQDSPKTAPELTAPTGIGRLVVGLEAKTIDGQTCALESQALATVIAFTDVSCPLTRRYAPTLANLEDKYKAKNVRFVFVNPSKVDAKADIQACVKDHGLDGDYVWDTDGRITAALGAQSTTEVFLLDSKNTLVYRGAVDDQYGLGYQIDAPRKTYLVDAIESVLNGDKPKVEATTAPGCALTVEAKPMARAVTYHDQVERIIQRNCVQCHRTGGVAPFTLDTYEKAQNYKGMIKQVVERGVMPPWGAAPGHGPWQNDRSMSDEDKQALYAWIAADCPKGDAKNAPTPLKFHDTWSIGDPDHVFQIPRALPVKATGQMPYIHIRIDTNFGEDKWVDAMEVLPTDRSVVHHVLVFIVQDGKIGGRGLLDVDESTGYLMGYVPGTDSLVFPEGQAKLIPKGATLLFQIHYTPNGKATNDQTRLAVRFAKKPPTNELQVYGVVNRTFQIPPGDPNFVCDRTITVPTDVYATALMPHMHVRGKAYKFEAVYPDGKREVLLDVPRYDFNWQITYRYAKPKLLPKGTKIIATAAFDNSADNPANPDPTRRVPWGLQTTDEMMLGYIEFYVPGAKPGETLSLGGG